MCVIFIEYPTLQVKTFSSWDNIIKLGGLKILLGQGNWYNKKCIEDFSQDYYKNYLPHLVEKTDEFLYLKNKI